jgi:hypothetical protein
MWVLPIQQVTFLHLTHRNHKHLIDKKLSLRFIHTFVLSFILWHYVLCSGCSCGPTYCHAHILPSSTWGPTYSLSHILRSFTWGPTYSLANILPSSTWGPTYSLAHVLPPSTSGPIYSLAHILPSSTWGPIYSHVRSSTMSCHPITSCTCVSTHWGRDCAREGWYGRNNNCFQWVYYM